MSTAHVTISLLPVNLSLVHIPRSRLSKLSRPILKQILQPNHSFLNLTCNQIELSIFAEDDMLAEFEPYACNDRQKRRQAERACKGGTSSCGRRKRPCPTHDESQHIETSFEKWNVLQIDSHEDSISNAGARVRELSAPLAAAGISILYQSSYMSDFIFVKATRLTEVMSLLGAAGFGLYSSDPYNLTSQMSPLLSPTTSDDNASLILDLPSKDEIAGVIRPHTPNRISTESGAVLSRTGTLASVASASLAGSKYTSLRDGTKSGLSSLFSNSIPPSTTSTTMNADRDSSPSDHESRSRVKKSMSPTSAPVDVLTPDLACVGLNDDAADIWSLKIVKLVAFPELIPTWATSPALHIGHDHQRDLSRSPIREFDSPHHTRDPSLVSDIPPYEIELRSSEGPTKSFPRPHRGAHWSLSSSGYSTSSSSSDGEDEYFSAPSPNRRSRDDVSRSTPSLVSGSSASRSYPDFEVSLGCDLHFTQRRPALSRLATLRGSDMSPPVAEIASPPAHFIGASSRKCNAEKVPFFSFTRTSEGSSLTTDVRLLASLFPPHERHMVICRDELLEAADRLKQREEGGCDWSTDIDGDADDVSAEEEGTMKCLQIDLQKYGLDKHGLVNRYSRVLEENGINHMYSSTYKTANLLVDKANAVRAQSLLRSC